jgi:hypothetical protein
MSNSHESTTPPDVSLLLRAHAEQRWLSREVIPVVRQIETRECLPEEQLPAALAYLEVIWHEALRRAREADATRVQLPQEDRDLSAKARAYHAAVLALREAVHRRVMGLLATSAGTSAQAHVWS